MSVKQSITLLRQSSSERLEVAMITAPNMSEELRDQVRSGLTAVDQNWFNSTDPTKMLSVAMLADEYETLGGESDD